MATDPNTTTISAVPLKPAQVFENEKVKKTILRNAPRGEDIKGMKIAVKKCIQHQVNLDEFIASISPFTADNGASLRAVMDADLSLFRKMARQVYETITQDNSDVLMNQQVQMAEFYKEQEDTLQLKSIKHVDEILQICPGFDFIEFNHDRSTYLSRTFPISEDLNLEPEDVVVLRRQEAYHRLQWLQSEGDRLKAENAKLQSKLAQLKKQFKKQQIDNFKRCEDAENQLKMLQNSELRKEQQLAALSEALEQRIIETETSLRRQVDENILTNTSTSKSHRRGPNQAKTSRKPSQRKNWMEKAAIDVDSSGIEERTKEELSRSATTRRFPTNRPVPAQEYC